MLAVWQANRMNPKPLPRRFFDRVTRYPDWGHKRAVLKLYRASRNLGAAFPEFAGGSFAWDVPVCVVWGAGDPFVPVEFAEKQTRYFPRAEVHILPGLGHWPFLDDPEAVRQPVVEFLRRQVRL